MTIAARGVDIFPHWVGIFKRFALNTDPKVIAAAVQEFAPRVPTKTAAVTEGGAK